MIPDYPGLLNELGRGPPLDLRPVSGGCIADARIAIFGDGSRVFVKSAPDSERMFRLEAEDLRTLAATETIRVPEMLAIGGDALVLEFIESGRGKPGFFESFGRRFARLHQHHGPAFGFPHDNFIGTTPQHNEPLGGCWEDVAKRQKERENGASWAEFFLERRLRFQARLASERRRGHELLSLLDRAEGRILELLGGAPEPPSLLHGDLWGGNFMVDEKGEPCLIDPAAYFGHREADLAMTRLFGGFDARFYNAYQEAAPLAPGHEDRLPLYQLYHLLNHLNLFGQSYYGQCLRILQRY